MYEISYRMVVNFRKIIKQLEYWSFPVDDEKWQNTFKIIRCKFFSTLDIRSGYYHITIAENSRKYAVFTTEYDKYEFLWVPFGIHLEPSYFTLMMNESLKGLGICFVYL